MLMYIFVGLIKSVLLNQEATPLVFSSDLLECTQTTVEPHPHHTCLIQLKNSRDKPKHFLIRAHGTRVKRTVSYRSISLKTVMPLSDTGRSVSLQNSVCVRV